MKNIIKKMQNISKIFTFPLPLLIPQSPTPTPYTLPPPLELQTYNTNVIKSTDYFSLLPSCIFGYCDKSCLFRGSVININLKTTVINIRSLNE